VPWAEAEEVMHYIRARDLDRLQAQLQGDITSFQDRYQVRPEPLEQAPSRSPAAGSIHEAPS
jgi:hypothetical protein